MRTTIVRVDVTGRQSLVEGHAIDQVPRGLLPYRHCVHECAELKNDSLGYTYSVSEVVLPEI